LDDMPAAEKESVGRTKEKRKQRGGGTKSIRGLRGENLEYPHIDSWKQGGETDVPGGRGRVRLHKDVLARRWTKEIEGKRCRTQGGSTRGEKIILTLRD